jgi:ubiquinone/menaquinone biosynthesis C-methylase UbiE
MEAERSRVCPVELAGSLDGRVRRWLQDPVKILFPFVKKGMKVLDIGCGPGFFSVEMAKMVGNFGKVISCDLQEGMLQKLRNKINGTELEDIITTVRCDKDNINVNDKVDFILAFFVVHEVPDKNSLFRQMNNALENSGEVLLVEPKLFHVTGKEFKETTKIATDNGFTVSTGPKILLSWSAVLKKGG